MVISNIITIQIKTQCQNLIYFEGQQVLYCINSQQQYTPYQQGAPYLYSKNGLQEKGTLKLITTDIDGYADIVNVKYHPLEPNEQGIYYQQENQDKLLYKLQGRQKFTSLDLSQIIVGSNLSYYYNGTDQQMKRAQIIHSTQYGKSISTLCSANFQMHGFKPALRVKNQRLKY